MSNFTEFGDYLEAGVHDVVRKTHTLQNGLGQTFKSPNPSDGWATTNQSGWRALLELWGFGILRTAWLSTSSDTR